MKAIVEQYAKGEFMVDRPEVVISKTRFEINIEAGTVYTESFRIESGNDCPIKGMVYDSRYMLHFENHSFISKSFEVKFSFDATCLEAGQSFHGHINVITDGGEFRLPYSVSVVEPCVRCGDEKVDDLFKFASIAESDWNTAASLFVSDDFKRTFINGDKAIRTTYESLLESRSVDQAMEEFLVLVSKKRSVTLTADKTKIDIAMPSETESITIDISKNTWGYTWSEIRSDSEFIIPAKKSISMGDFTGGVCTLTVYISPEHVPEGENSGKLIIENIYQTIEVEIHLSKPLRARPNQENRQKTREYKSCRITLVRNYLNFRMDRMSLGQYTDSSIEALRTLNELEPENSIYRLGIMHMNILNGDYTKVEQEFLRIEADVDKTQMSAQQLCYYEYLQCMIIRKDEKTRQTAELIRKNYRTGEPKIFYFWLLLFVDPVLADDKNRLYSELEALYKEGKNSPIVYFELVNILNANPMMLKKLTPFEITAVKWGLRHNFISDDVLLEFVKLAGRTRGFNKQIFDVLRQIYDKNETALKQERRRVDAAQDTALKNTAADYLDPKGFGRDIEGYDAGLVQRRKQNLSADDTIAAEDDERLAAEEAEERILARRTRELEDDRPVPETETEGIQKRESALDAAVRAEEAEKLSRKESENQEVLSSICSMLISANMLDHKYHRFYRDAVMRNLKFIGLNECYIRSMRRDRYELIPASVLMYLNYKNTLTEDELAFLYADVIFNKAEHMKIYHEYAPTMEDFMENMIVKGKVNDDLTVIYDEFLNPDQVNSLYAGKLINIIFRRKIVCANKNLRSVIVSHDELQNVQHVPLVNGEAYVEILSEHATIVFEDNYGNRYAGSIPYHFERIVDEKAYMPICREYSPQDYRVVLYNYENIGEFTYKNAAEVNTARKVLYCDEISYDYKQQAVLNIVEYYHENLDADVLRKYLDRVDIEYLTHTGARAVISYLIDMNMFAKAFQAVRLYGFNELDVNELYRLADYGVQDPEGFDNENLMAICINLYKTGTVNPNILSYLAANFKGSLEELSNLFKLAKDRIPEIGSLAENILAQMMFSNAHVEYIYDVFLTYYGGRNRGLVVKAFLRLTAHRFLVNDAQVPNFVFRFMFEEIRKGNIDDEVSAMAMLLYFSRVERYNTDEKKWIEENVKRFTEAGRVLPFFKNFASFIRLPQDIFLKTYLVYKTERVRDVMVKYSFDTGTRSRQKLQTRRMEEIVPGVYVMEFVVFHGERLVYSVEDDPDGNARIVESDVLKKTSFSSKSKNRFETINSMLVKQEMREDSELLEDLDVYLNTVHLFETELEIL